MARRIHHFAALTDVGSWSVSTDRALDQFDILRDLAGSPANSPRLVYAHIGLPHPPFLLDAQCEGWDNPDPDEWGITPDLSEPYLMQLRCVNRQVSELIEAIDRSNPDTVVVITGDHGVHLHGQWYVPAEQWTPEIIEESTATLSAYRLPTGCRDVTSDSFAVVNTFRIVIDCLFDQDLGSIPTQQFHAESLHVGSPEVAEFPAPLR